MEPPVGSTASPEFNHHIGQGRPVALGRNLPPLFGGTMKALRNQASIVVADPDRGRVVIVDRANLSIRQLDVGNDALPFRVIEHPTAGVVSVVLRGTGDLLTFAVTGDRAEERRHVCDEPRGGAFDTLGNRLVIACASGQVMTLPDSGGVATEVARLDRDLRDVAISGDTVSISLFRSAEIVQLSRTDFQQRARVRPRLDFGGGTPDATVGWRMVGMPGGQTVLTHQLAEVVVVNPDPAAGGYGSSVPTNGCGSGGSIVTNALTVGLAGSTRTVMMVQRGLPLDVAVSDDGLQIAVVYANEADSPRVFRTSLNAVVEESSQCAQHFASFTELDARGLVTSVDFTADGQIAAFQAEPPALYIGATRVPLGGSTILDTGRDAFHFVTSAGLACASCHPEGGEDGHTWQFAGLGPRRTQSLSGGLGDSAPFHWNGDMADFPTLVNDVMTGRMRGPALEGREVGMLKSWIDHIPHRAAVVARDPEMADRGRVLFQSAEVGCTSCHNGLPLVGSFDVGTGGVFQVPRLDGVAYRAPFLHNGCAVTIRDRFTWACGGGDSHGHTTQLSASQLDDLAAYVETL